MPGGKTEAAVRALADCPPEMGFSYPANAGWRLWALAQGRPGRCDRQGSSRALGPDGLGAAEQHPAGGLAGRPDSRPAMEPLRRRAALPRLPWPVGLQPLAPGFQRVELRPQLADLADLDLTAFTVLGPLNVRAQGPRGNREVTLRLPPSGHGELVLPREEVVELPAAAGPMPAGHRRFALTPGSTVTLHLKHI